MTDMNQASVPARQDDRPKNIIQLMNSENIKKRIDGLLKNRAGQFIASVTTLVNATPQLSNARPESVLAACMTAAALDLPINKDLGFAHIIPYKDVAQFQLGFKGLIQLAMRSGQYTGMNASPVNAEAFGGYDPVGEPIIHWPLIDEAKDPVGYVFAFRLTNGFSKAIYWTTAKIEDHAKRYSQVYRKDLAEDSKRSVWSTNFPAMALKTVIKAGLGKWGILSVEMQQALQEDQGAKKNLDDAPFYPDNPKPEGEDAPATSTGAADALAKKGAQQDGVPPAGSASTPAPQDPGKPPPAFNQPLSENGRMEMLDAIEKMMNNKPARTVEKALKQVDLTHKSWDAPEVSDAKIRELHHLLNMA